MTDRNELRIRHMERVLGETAHEFLRSDLGQFVIGKSLEAVTQCLDELSTVDASDSKLISQLQQDIAIAKIGLHWINDALLLGDQRHAHDEIEATRTDYSDDL